MTVYDSACAASFTHLQSAVRNGQTSVTVNGFVLAVMITGKIFLTGYDKQIALWVLVSIKHFKTQYRNSPVLGV